MGKSGQQYSMAYCIKDFWEIQEDTYDKLSIFEATINLSVSTTNAM